ncbi:MAG TPA: CBS domain-containing protein [Oscillatoriaceae cyanobacterium]
MSTVRDLMTANPVCATCDTTLQDAARMMQRADCGILPVLEQRRLRGVITDRDIVLRAVAKGVDTKAARVGDFLTDAVFTISPEADCEIAMREMEARQVRRLFVVDQGQLIGVVALGDLAESEPKVAEEVLVEVSKSPKTLAHKHL